MAALGQKRSYAPGHANVRISQKADIPSIAFQLAYPSMAQVGLTR
jgi:hypothetical protein